MPYIPLPESRPVYTPAQKVCTPSFCLSRAHCLCSSPTGSSTTRTRWRLTTGPTPRSPALSTRRRVRTRASSRLRSSAATRTGKRGAPYRPCHPPHRRRWHTQHAQDSRHGASLYCVVLLKPVLTGLQDEFEGHPTLDTARQGDEACRQESRRRWRVDLGARYRGELCQ